MTDIFLHLHLAPSLNIPTKTFFSVRLTKSKWSTKVTSTFTYSTRRNMAIFHPILATAFRTGNSNHPQNFSRIFNSKYSLFDLRITIEILGSPQHSPTQPTTNVIVFQSPHIKDCIPQWKEKASPEYLTDILFKVIFIANEVLF